MARPLRIEFDGARHNEMARQCPRRDLLGYADRDDFVDLLFRVAERFDWLMWAFCLMAFRPCSRILTLGLTTGFNRSRI